MERQHRLGRPPLDEAKTPTSTTPATPRTMIGAEPQRIGRAAEAREQHEARRGEHEDDGPEVVDDVVDAAQVARHLAGDDRERDGADRDVDVEDPAPGELLDEDAAEQRADDARHAEDRPEQSLVAAAFAGRDDVADDRLGADHQAAAAEALDGPEGDELDHASG